MMATVRVKFLRGTSLGNGSDAMPGDVIDIDAHLLPAYLLQRRVVEVPPPPAVTEAAPVAVPKRTKGK
jgi:hypothetical protein